MMTVLLEEHTLCDVLKNTAKMRVHVESSQCLLGNRQGVAEHISWIGNTCAGARWCPWLALSASLHSRFSVEQA